MSKVGAAIMMASVAGLLLAGPSAYADTITWNGLAGDGEFATAGNWDGLVVSTNIAQIINGATVQRLGNATVSRTYVSGGSILNVTGGTQSDSQAGNSTRNFVGNGSVGTVNMSGGSYDIGHVLAIAHSTGSTGTFKVTGGFLNVGRGGNSLVGGYGGNFGLGHTISVGGDKASTGVTGLFEISGGSLATRTGVAVGNNGTFSVLGSATTSIRLGGANTDAGWFLVSSNGALKVGVEVGGVTPIFVEAYVGTNTSAPQAVVEFQSGSILDVGYYNGGYGGGTWTVVEIENGSITNNGLKFAPGVNTNIWSFAVDNSGANGKLTVTAPGAPAQVPPDVTLTVGNTNKQMMRYGLDYERLWYWYGSGLGPVPQWSVVDCEIDYIRCAVNSEYELTNGVYDLSAYTGKIIPMMTAMQNANPNIKWFATPRPLNEAVSGASWQPYPIWITGATSYTSGDYDFNPTNCAQYLIRYLRLMKHYGFKISYLDLSNEWQTNDGSSGGRLTQTDARDLVEYMKDYIANPPSPGSDPTDPTGFYTNYPALVAGDMPLTVAPSSWNYSQGASWINNLDTQRRRDAVDIASSHNTDRTGTAENFAAAVKNTLGPETEIWETEQHGWKSTSGEDEVTSFHYYLESIRAGFTGINGWLAIGTTSQGHCYLLNNGSTVTRNVKYYIFKKLSTTSNFGRALDVNLPYPFTQTAALIRENLMTVWVVNESTTNRLTEINVGNRTIANPTIRSTLWRESLAVEGLTNTVTATSNNTFRATVEGDAVYCFEIELVPTGASFPFLQAENFSTNSGGVVQACSDAGGGSQVNFPSSGNQLSFNLDVSRTGSYDIAFRVASAGANIKFDLYDGTNVLATVDCIATGGAQAWTTIYQTVTLNGGATTLKVQATGGGWNLNWLNCSPVFVPPTPTNLALNQTASASNVHSSGYEADKVVDGNTGTRWATAVSNPWLQVDFASPTTVNSSKILDYGNRTKGYEIQYFDGTWMTAFTGGDPDDSGQVDFFPPVTSTQFRLQITSSTGSPSIWEFELYNDPYYATSNPTPAIAVDPNSVAISWMGLPGSTYSLQRSTNLVTAPFITIESGIPVTEATNIRTMVKPGPAAFYRVVRE